MLCRFLKFSDIIVLKREPLRVGLYFSVIWCRKNQVLVKLKMGFLHLVSGFPNGQ